MNLNLVKDRLHSLIRMAAKTTDLDFAIFDTKAQLIISTRHYLERKGDTVHSASIFEVLDQGSAVVHKPGFMPSCLGCRFAENCPASIEILSCIKIEDYPLGVISLTSFKDEGHAMIEANIRKYMDILLSLAELISHQLSGGRDQNSLLNLALDQSGVNFTRTLILDTRGQLLHMGRDLRGTFSHCGLYTTSIFQLLDRDLINQIFSSHLPVNFTLETSYFHGFIELIPLEEEKGLAGYCLNFHPRADESPQNLDYLNAIQGEDPALVLLKEKIIRLSSSSSSVLIGGETGTGKEMVARAIHSLSPRKNGPFIPINCANIPESLFESELFGYEEGSFTGARKGGKPGLFELATGGTLLLDEIGELSLYQQAKLLRVLQENAIQRVGSLEITPIDVRIIAATNRDLEGMIERGDFREDLFYRINVIPLDLPPLRKRRQDIPILIDHFIKKHSEILGREPIKLDTEALKLLQAFPWPGNIRELENAIEYAINMTTSSLLGVSELPQRIRKEKTPDYRGLIKKGEKELIIEALQLYGRDTPGKKMVARELGISLRTLYRRLEKYDIDY